jgi:hypothetical protein
MYTVASYLHWQLASLSTSIRISENSTLEQVKQGAVRYRMEQAALRQVAEGGDGPWREYVEKIVAINIEAKDHIPHFWEYRQKDRLQAVKDLYQAIGWEQEV